MNTTILKYAIQPKMALAKCMSKIISLVSVFFSSCEERKASENYKMEKFCQHWDSIACVDFLAVRLSPYKYKQSRDTFSQSPVLACDIHLANAVV